MKEISFNFNELSVVNNFCFWFRCLSIVPEGSSYKSVNRNTGFQHNFICKRQLSKFNQELSTKSFHQCFRSLASASQNVGRSCSTSGFRPFSSHASKEKKSRKMLLYLTGVVFAMVGSTYAAVPLYRRFCQATGYGGTVQRREVRLSLLSMVFHFLNKLIGNFSSCTIFYIFTDCWRKDCTAW